MLKKQIVGKYKEKNLTYVFFQQIIKKCCIINDSED